MAGIQIDGVNNKIDFDDDADTSISSATDDTLVIESGGVNVASITSSGIDVTGSITASSASTINVTGGSALTLKSTDAGASAGPVLRLTRDSSSPADGDITGEIDFIAENDASEAITYSQISSRIDDASDGTEDGRLFFFTQVGGSSTERLRFNGTETVFNEGGIDLDFRVETAVGQFAFFVNGQSGVGTAGFYNAFTSTQVAIENQDAPNGRVGLFITHPSSSDLGEGIVHRSTRSSSLSSNFHMKTQSNNGADNEFSIRGDGNVFCDGSFSGGGADYAEYFEWKDGNGSDEDRVGYSVVLDGNKIVKATDSDDANKIIGVISVNPAVVGDSDIDRWKQKFLLDDFGREITEEITVTEWRGEHTTDEGIFNKNYLYSYDTDRIPNDVTVPSDAEVKSVDANGNKFLRRKTNPDWNENEAYISREDRKEWDTVGLMGKLRLRKGQPTGTNWIKMRDISDTVEEWLVR